MKLTDAMKKNVRPVVWEKIALNYGYDEACFAAMEVVLAGIPDVEELRRGVEANYFESIRARNARIQELEERIAHAIRHLTDDGWQPTTFDEGRLLAILKGEV